MLPRKCRLCGAPATSRLALLDEWSRQIPDGSVWVCEHHVEPMETVQKDAAVRYGYRLAVLPTAAPAAAGPDAWWPRTN